VEDVSIHLDTPADVRYHVNVSASMAGRISAVAEMAQIRQAGRDWARIAMCTELPNLVFISKLLHDSMMISLGPPPNESFCIYVRF
jgi:hypothetical protein